MADIQIIGGRTGSPHIDIYEVSALFRSLIGGESHYAYVTGENSKLQPRVVNSNGVAVQPGGLFLQGSYMRVPLGQVGDVTGTLIEGQTKAVLYIDYSQDNQTGVDSAEFKIFNGNYESYISANPVSRLENASKSIKVGIYEITYSTLGGQAAISGYALTPDCKELLSLFTDANNIATNAGNIETQAAAIQTLTAALSEMSNRLNSYKITRSGQVTFSKYKNNTVYQIYVKLKPNDDTPSPFKSPPSVVVTPNSKAPQQISVSVTDITKDGFNINFYRTTGTLDTGVLWTATDR